MNVEGEQDAEGLQNVEGEPNVEGEQAGIAAPPDDELVNAIVRREPLEVVRSIVERRPELVTRTDEYGYLPLHAAVESGSPLEVLECMYWPCTSAISTRVGQHQVLPVHCVGHQSPPECVAFLLDRHPRSIKLKTAAGELPVHCAISNGAPRDAIRRLVGGLPGSIAERDPVGRLAIHVAASASAAHGPHHRLDVIRYLVEAAPMSVRERSHL
jgi:hypothetical protein